MPNELIFMDFEIKGLINWVIQIGAKFYSQVCSNLVLKTSFQKINRQPWPDIDWPLGTDT